MALASTADLLIVRQRITVATKKCTEALYFMPGSGATKTAKLKDRVADIRKLCDIRASLMPAGVSMRDCHVGYLGGKADSRQVLGSTLFGDTATSGHLAGEPNRYTDVLVFAFVPESESTCQKPLHGPADDWMVQSGFTIPQGAQTIGIREKVSILTAPTRPPANTNDDLRFQRWIDAVLYYSVYARQWRTGDPGTGPYVWEAWDSGNFHTTGTRKMGEGWDQKKGHKPAYT